LIASSPLVSHVLYSNGNTLRMTRMKTRLWARGTNASYLFNNAGDFGAAFYSDGTAGMNSTRQSQHPGCQ